MMLVFLVGGTSSFFVHRVHVAAQFGCCHWLRRRGGLLCSSLFAFGLPGATTWSSMTFSSSHDEKLHVGMRLRVVLGCAAHRVATPGPLEATGRAPPVREDACFEAPLRPLSLGSSEEASSLRTVVPQ